MASEAMDEYFIYDNRLASFTTPQPIAAKRRGSNASSRAPKALSWPHKSLKPADMAKAGFVFTPLPSNPDNVTCFLCTKALDGWEQDDRPLEEHLKHSPECGWAITAAVEAELGNYAAEDPRDALMVEARKATFADMWPHESRKGWSSVKTKALVEAGWKYTPLVGSEDNATDEHYNRAPNCPFFSLISSKPAPKTAGRSKAARSSKASRLSLQSVATSISDMTLLADRTTDIDDSVMTTASNVTTASKASKKPAKGKKAAASRPRKTRAKKSEAVEVHEDEPQLEQEEDGASPPPSRSGNGLKRTSDEMEGSVLTNAEAPVSKKRATKSRKVRGSSATEVFSADTEVTGMPEPAKKSAAKKSTRKASGSRKAYGRSTRKGSVSTVASTASPPPEMPDDEEIDRQLQVDLERPLDDDEDVPMNADPETSKAAASRMEHGLGGTSQEDLAKTDRIDFAVSDPDPPQPADEVVEPDLLTRDDAMDVDVKEPEPEPRPELQPELQELKVPKKGRKAGTRKVSKQTTKKTKEVVAPVVEQTQSRIAVDAEEPDEIAEAEVSFASSGTVKRTSVGRASLGSASLPRASLDSVASTAAAKAPAKRGRPPKKKPEESLVEDPATVAPPPDPVLDPTLEAIAAGEPTPKAVVKPEKKTSTARPRGRPPKARISEVSPEEHVEVQDHLESEPKSEPVVQKEVETEDVSVQEEVPSASGSPWVGRKPVPAPKDSPFAIQRKAIGSGPAAPSQIVTSPKTPRHHTNPAQSAKQATISPSPSPQASDAENRPPSSKPNTNSSKGKRMPLGELPITTPARQTSPLKQQQQKNAGAGLQTSEPWTAVDLDLVFEGETGAAERFFTEGSELSSAERGMTVEEWIYYNAGRAEQKLKSECETMVNTFEREGTRAMRALEGLVVEE
ncbi:hypothetical protein N0V82_006152 [Gnomoniopsis sp. IMI 355080]|nr:hypothetical protein N0V82_006152 [Gnomoniopsis sp. IMI 355080]